MYDHPFFITDKRSNNAFSFERRVNPMVWVPDMIDGDLNDVEVGNKVVFEDFDESGQLKSCVGLKHFVRMRHPKSGKPIVIVDNHNHVFYFWHESLSKGQIKKGATLVHIDQHKDMRKPPLGLARGDNKNLRKIFEYTNSVLNVGNYILPAIEDGLVGKVISITSETELRKTIIKPKGSLIVNVDLDFWAPEMDYIDPKLKIRRTKEWMAVADFITIATSPFFIEQTLAIDFLRRLFEPKDL
jgi:hypothetical protein